MLKLLIVLTLSATAFIYSYRQSPLSQSRVCQATQLRTDGVYCREPASTGPVALNKVVPVAGAAVSGITMDRFLCASLFPYPLIVCTFNIIAKMCHRENIEGMHYSNSTSSTGILAFNNINHYYSAKSRSSNLARGFFVVFFLFKTVS